MANSPHRPRRHYEVKLLSPSEINDARHRLGLSCAGIAELLMLSPENGPDKVAKWEAGEQQITGPASQAIRFALAIMKLESPPERPKDRPVGGYHPILEEFVERQE